MDSAESTGPQPNPVTIAVEKSALLVLDGSQRWGDPSLAYHRLVPPMKTFLDMARDVGLPIIYTI